MKQTHTVLAENVVKSGLCGVHVTWMLDSSGTLIISGSGNMESNPQMPWHAFRNSIRRVVIRQGVTSICAHAFCGCSSMEEFTFPDSITEIGTAAFALCSGLTHLTLPQGVRTISQSTFSDCSRLKSITLPCCLTYIGEYAFFNCRSLERIVIPDDVTCIDSYAFTDCSSLKQIIFPDSLHTLGCCAFFNCSSLESTAVPDSLTDIGQHAFFRCTRSMHRLKQKVMHSISDRNQQDHTKSRCCSLLSRSTCFFISESERIQSTSGFSDAGSQQHSGTTNRKSKLPAILHAENRLHRSGSASATRNTVRIMY